MRIISIKPIKKPKKFTKSDKDRVIQILKDNYNILNKLEKRIYKEELKDG
jgi:hypothetical protein